MMSHSSFSGSELLRVQIRVNSDWLMYFDNYGFSQTSVTGGIGPGRGAGGRDGPGRGRWVGHRLDPDVARENRSPSKLCKLSCTSPSAFGATPVSVTRRVSAVSHVAVPESTNECGRSRT